MRSVMRHPPQWPTLGGSGAEHRPGEPHNARKANGPMGESPVIERTDPERTGGVRAYCHRQRHGTPGDNHDGQRGAMDQQERHPEPPRTALPAPEESPGRYRHGRDQAARPRSRPRQAGLANTSCTSLMWRSRNDASQ